MADILAARAFALPVSAFADTNPVVGVWKREGDKSLILSAMRRKLLLCFLATLANDEEGVAWCSDYIAAQVTSSAYESFRVNMLRWHPLMGISRTRLVLIHEGREQFNPSVAYGLDILMGRSVDVLSAMRPYATRHATEACGPNGYIINDESWAWLRPWKTDDFTPYVEPRPDPLSFLIGREDEKFGG